MADLAKARRLVQQAIDEHFCDDNGMPECVRCRMLREGLAVLPSEPADVAGLAVLSDYLKDHGQHALLSAVEDPVKELLELRSEAARLRRRIDQSAIVSSYREGGVAVTYRGSTVHRVHPDATFALAEALRGLADEIDARTAGGWVPRETPPQHGVPRWPTQQASMEAISARFLRAQIHQIGGTSIPPRPPFAVGVDFGQPGGDRSAVVMRDADGRFATMRTSTATCLHWNLRSEETEFRTAVNVFCDVCGECLGHLTAQDARGEPGHRVLSLADLSQLRPGRFG